MPQLDVLAGAGGQAAAQQPMLYQGLQGEDVRKLQEQLTSLGYDVGGVDAIFGPKTTAAVREFQRDYGLDVDAIVGPQTWGALTGGAAPVPTIPEVPGTGATPQEVQRLQRAVAESTPPTIPEVPGTGATPQEVQRLQRAVAGSAEPPAAATQGAAPAVPTPPTSGAVAPTIAPPPAAQPTAQPAQQTPLTQPYTQPYAQPATQLPQFPQVPAGESPYAQDAAALLEQLRQRIAQPVDYTQTPQYQAAMQAAQQQAKRAAQMAAEYLNARGILASTITRDEVAKVYQDAMLNVLPDLIAQAYNIRQDEIRNLFNVFQGYLGLSEEQTSRQRQAWEQQMDLWEQQIAQQEREIERAWARTKTRGYVDNTDAAILGVPPGTMSYEARVAYDNLQAELTRIRAQGEETRRTQQLAYEREMTPEKEYRQRAYAKLLRGEPLTSDERQVLGLTSGGTNREATQAVLEGIVDSLRQGASVDTVVANVLTYVPLLVQQGVDLKQVYDYLERLQLNVSAYPQPAE
ncbi:MAG: peptidoglycan-binding domain-containing protein [Candidatus Omnitrophica bacterium]|nr:peptidoglycan-binding domain-containing protein [Candidatus Omnitrophota bacterium]